MELDKKKGCDMMYRMDQIRLMIDSNVREKADGRMVASFGRNLANEESNTKNDKED